MAAKENKSGGTLGNSASAQLLDIVDGNEEEGEVEEEANIEDNTQIEDDF